MKLVDKDWLLNALGLFNYKQHGDLHFINGIRTASEIIEDAETVELIRCKDCIFYNALDGYCRNHSFYKGKELYLYVDDDDFCSWAKRKDEE